MLELRPAALLLFLSPGTLAAQGAPAFEEALAHAIERGRAAMREHMIGSGRAPGCAVAVALRGEVVWEEGFGTADLEHEVPAGARTRFGLGSVSKPLTTACLASLAEEGLVDLDAPIETYLEDFPFAGAGITLRRLAAHQSGLTDDVTARHADTNVRYPDVASAYAEIVAGESLAHPPGTAVAYANGTYTIIARVMEAVSGEGYLELMQARVFSPADMQATVPDDRRRIVPDRTGFYHMLEEGRFENATHHDSSIKLAAAGWLATAGDVARFGAALVSGELLGVAGMDEYFRTVPLADGRATQYGLGLRRAEDDGRTVWELPGGGHGISTWLLLYPDQELSIAILSNCNRGPVGGPVLGVLAEEFVRVAEMQ